MITNELISFAIPTYNRSVYLDVCLEKLIDTIKEYDIKIYVSDNCSTDNTNEIVNKWQQSYKNLYYHRNETNLDMDGNFEKVLNLPNSKYIWLFGDTYEIGANNLNYLLNLIEPDSISYDSIIFNYENIISYPTKNYQEQNELLIDLSGIMSCVSCLVYNKDLIKNASFKRYRDTFFSLEAIIFEYIDNKEFIIHWAQNQSVKNLQIDSMLKKNWSNSPRMFEIGIEGWLKFIYSLPASYTLESKSRVEKLFANNSGLLSYGGLIIRRIDGAINMSLLMSNSNKFIRVSSYSKFLYTFVLCCIPKLVLKKILSVTKIILRKNK